MNFFDILKLSIQNFNNRRSRVLLTVLGVAVGIAVIMFLVSVGYGLQKTILDRITTAEALLTLDVSSPDNASVVIDDRSIAEITDIENVNEVSPRATVSSLMSLNGLNSQTTVNIVGAQHFILSGLSIGEGELFGRNEADVVVVTETVANLVGFEKEDILDKTINFTLQFPIDNGVDSDEDAETIGVNKQLRVIGVLQEGVTDNVVFMSLANADDLPLDNYDGMKVQVTDARHLESVREILTAQGFVVSALSDLAEQASQVFTILQIILSVFGIFSLLVAAIGLVNTMIISLLERTNEIGIMRAIGASKRDIQALFLIESSIIGLAGGVIGLVFGWAGGMFFNLILNIVLKVLGGSGVSVFTTPLWFVLLVLISSIGVGLLAGFFPARRASELNTLAALRYK